MFNGILQEVLWCYARDIFSSGSIVEEGTFQGKGDLKVLSHTKCWSQQKEYSAKENTHIKCF